MDWLLIFKCILLGSISIGALVLAYLVLQMALIVGGVRRIVDKVDLILDVKSWFGLFRRFSPRRRSKD